VEPRNGTLLLERTGGGTGASTNRGGRRRPRDKLGKYQQNYKKKEGKKGSIGLAFFMFLKGGGAQKTVKPKNRKTGESPNDGG